MSHLVVPVARSTPDEKHQSYDDEKNASPPRAESFVDGDSEKGDPDYGSYGDHIFSNPEVAAHWAAVYEKAHYEGRHRFDPTFTWSAAEERAVRRKVREVSRISLK